MRVCIHRGTREIGGTVVELEADGQRLLLDCGLPLGTEADDPVPMPPVAGLVEPDDTLLGVVLSHGHRDHWGLLAHTRPDLPLYMGAATERIFAAAAPFVPDQPGLKAAGHLVDGERLVLGPFTVTPHLVDHSAFDAYALTVEAGGKRLFYGGDLRGHGRKGGLFEKLVKHPPPDIDAMLLEGSSFGRLDEQASFPTESEIEERLVERIGETPGLVLVAASAQNIDRVVSVFRAARRTARSLVVDLYAAEILRATERSTIPQTSWPDVVTFVPFHQRVRIKKTERFDLLSPHGDGRIYPEDLTAHPERFVVLFRASLLADLERAGCLGGARAIWSQWSGYLAEDRGKALVAALAAHGLGLEVIHTSGHASIGDLKRLAEAIAPKALVPIHTFEAERYPEIFNDVVVRHDGEWWEV
ncbi:MAG: MBL fold metallo-hydrolase [Thermoanaerobaculia bacterium]